MVSLVSGTVSGFARTLGHYISFGVTVTMMIVVNIFIANVDANWVIEKYINKILFNLNPLLMRI